MSSKARRDPPLLPPQHGPRTSKTLFVGGLPKNMLYPTLYNRLNSVFETQNGVLSICVQCDRCGNPLGHAYANFETPEDAENALKSLQFKINIGGKQCRLMYKRKEFEISTKCTLYVHNLHPSITEEELNNKFSEYGIIDSKITRNQTNESLGYGYMSFDNPNYSRKALNMNGSLFHGQILKIEQFIPKHQRQKMPQYTKSFTNVYVKNIPFGMKQQRIISMFEDGINAKITSFSFKSINTYQTFALLNFDTCAHAMEAIQKFNGKKLGKNHTLYVCRAQTRKERDFNLTQFHKANSAILSKTNLKIKNLAPTVDNRALRNKFKQFGWIKRYTVSPKGSFGFVEFNLAKDAQRAMATLNNKRFHYRVMSISFAKQRRKINRYDQRRNTYFNMNINNDFVPQFQPRFDEENEIKYEQESDESNSKQNSDSNPMSDFAKQRLLQRDLSSKINDLYPHCAGQIVEQLLKLDNDTLQNLVKNEAKFLRKVIKIESELNGNRMREEQKYDIPIPKQEKKEEIECDNEQKKESEVVKDSEFVVWMGSIVSLPQYMKHFLCAGFEELETIKTMTEKDLKEIGIDTLGHRRKFLMEICKLQTAKDSYPDEGINQH